MEGKLCRIAEDTFFVIPGFERTVWEYYLANYNADLSMIITEETMDIPSSAMKVAEGLWKQVA